MWSLGRLELSSRHFLERCVQTEGDSRQVVMVMQKAAMGLGFSTLIDDVILSLKEFDQVGIKHVWRGN